MIRTTQLTKAFGSRLAVDSVNLDIPTGEMYGFLGPNGAGKTTTIRLILGLLRPTRGEIWLAGRQVRGPRHAEKGRVGVMAERELGMDDLTGREYLAFFAALYHVRQSDARIAALIDVLDLGAHADERLQTYSRGLRQKIGLARALVHDPDVLILDEPTAGLDPHGVRQVRDLLLTENRRGRTVFLSSHLLSEIEQTCHRVGILAQGHLVAQDEPGKLKAALAPAQTLEIHLESPSERAVAVLTNLPQVQEVQHEGCRLWVTAEPGDDIRPAVSHALGACGAFILSMTASEMSLEEVFVTLTDRSIARVAQHA